MVAHGYITVGVIIVRFLLFAGVLFSLSSARAAITWDPINTADGSTITEGSGTWDNSGNTFWNPNTGGNNVSYTSGSDVIFGGGGVGSSPFTVTVAQGIGQDITANSITFNSGALYTIDDPSGNRVLT